MLSRAAAGPAIAMAGLRVRLIDATCISEPGSDGTDWRLQVCFDPARAAIDHVEVTDVHGGEHLERAAALAGDLILGDRGYAGSDKIRALAASGAHTLVRIGHSAVRLFDECGEQWDPLAFAARRRPTKGRPPRIEGRDAWLHGAQEPPLPVRLVVVRKSREAAEHERVRIRTEAKRKGKEPSRRTLETAAFTFLLTTLPESRITAEDIADLYRMRWQVELAFKRLKSLLNLDALRAKDPALARSYLLGKLIAALLIQRIADQCRAISPYGIPIRREAQPVA